MFNLFVKLALVLNVAVTISLLVHIDEIIAGQSVNALLAIAQIITGLMSAGVLGNLLGNGEL